MSENVGCKSFLESILCGQSFYLKKKKKSQAMLCYQFQFCHLSMEMLDIKFMCLHKVSSQIHTCTANCLSKFRLLTDCMVFIS